MPRKKSDHFQGVIIIIIQPKVTGALRVRESVAEVSELHRRRKSAAVEYNVSCTLGLFLASLPIPPGASRTSH